MAEIGLIASIIQVAGAGLKLAETLYQYADSVASADRRIGDIATEVKLTSYVIDELASVFRQDETSTLLSKNAIMTADETVRQCSSVFAQLDVEIKKSQKKKIGKFILPFKEPKIELLRSHIEKLKSTLQLLMQVLTHAHQVASQKLDREAEAAQREQIKALLQNKKESTKRYEESLRNYRLSEDSTVHGDDGLTKDIDISQDSVSLVAAPPVSSLITVQSVEANSITVKTLETCVEHIHNLLNDIEKLQDALSKQDDKTQRSERQQYVVGSYFRARGHLDSILLGNPNASKTGQSTPTAGTQPGSRPMPIAPQKQIEGRSADMETNSRVRKSKRDEELQALRLEAQRREALRERERIIAAMQEKREDDVRVGISKTLTGSTIQSIESHISEEETRIIHSKLASSDAITFTKEDIQKAMMIAVEETRKEERARAAEQARKEAGQGVIIVEVDTTREALMTRGTEEKAKMAATMEVDEAELEAELEAETEENKRAEQEAKKAAEEKAINLERAASAAKADASREKMMRLAAAEEAKMKAAMEAAEAKLKALKEAEVEAYKRAELEAKAAFEREKKAKAASETRPIRFTDAVGRKFNFPFHICNNWQGMEHLIKQAFISVDDMSTQVSEGRYDLLNPEGEIILPSCWEVAIKPGWDIRMKMWPAPVAPPRPPPRYERFEVSSTRRSPRTDREPITIVNWKPETQDTREANDSFVKLVRRERLTEDWSPDDEARARARARFPRYEVVERAPKPPRRAASPPIVLSTSTGHKVRSKRNSTRQPSVRRPIIESRTPGPKERIGEFARTSDSGDHLTFPTPSRKSGTGRTDSSERSSLLNPEQALGAFCANRTKPVEVPVSASTKSKNASKHESSASGDVWDWDWEDDGTSQRSDNSRGKRRNTTSGKKVHKGRRGKKKRGKGKARPGEEASDKESSSLPPSRMGSPYVSRHSLKLPAERQTAQPASTSILLEGKQRRYSEASSLASSTSGDVEGTAGLLAIDSDLIPVDVGLYGGTFKPHFTHGGGPTHRSWGRPNPDESHAARAPVEAMTGPEPEGVADVEVDELLRDWTTLLV